MLRRNLTNKTYIHASLTAQPFHSFVSLYKKIALTDLLLFAFIIEIL